MDLSRDFSLDDGMIDPFPRAKIVMGLLDLLLDVTRKREFESSGLRYLFVDTKH